MQNNIQKECWGPVDTVLRFEVDENFDEYKVQYEYKSKDCFDVWFDLKSSAEVQSSKNQDLKEMSCEKDSNSCLKSL